MKIIASGFVGKFWKLAEIGDSHAKKILRKLSSSRFQSVYNKIWSL
jgi:hypothetical protein